MISIFNLVSFYPFSRPGQPIHQVLTTDLCKQCWDETASIVIFHIISVVIQLLKTDVYEVANPTHKQCISNNGSLKKDKVDPLARVFFAVKNASKRNG